MSQLRNRSILSVSHEDDYNRISQDPQYTIFKTILNDAGVILSLKEEKPIILKQEQSLVVRDLEKCLTNDYQTNLEQFIKALKKFCRNEDFLKKGLLPTELQKYDNIRTVEQDSLLRIFLKVNNLQKIVTEIILDKITLTDDEPDIPLRLLLNQLRYLPKVNVDSLSQKLIDIIEILETPSQLDILDALPEIIPDDEYDTISEQLCRLLNVNNETLFGGIIDCLNSLNLNTSIRNKAREYVLNKMSGNSLKIFPIILDFIMIDWKAQTLPLILNKIRNTLDNIMLSGIKDKEKESLKIIIFQKLERDVRAFKQISENWLNVISSINESTNHKPIDLLILFMIYTSGKIKKRIIEIFIRKRIKDGLFRCLLLEKLFDNYIPQQLLYEYFTSIIEIGCNLLRISNESNIIEFVTLLFKLLFNNPNIEMIYRQQLLDSLILLTCTIDQKNITNVLNILLILSDDIDKMKNHTILLMRLLEKLDSFDLKDVKLIFEILCKLTCSDESLSGFRDEIHMIIRKQLSSWKKIMKYRGIISAVVLAKYIASIPNNSDIDDISISENSIISINQLGGDAKNAALLLGLADNSTNNFPDLLGLYYDQLSAMLIKSDNLDKNFILWLYESITNNFQKLFVTDNIPEPVDDITFSIQYNLNKDDEIDAPLAINIAGLILNNANNKTTISILPSHFRLLRLLHYKQNDGDLSTIDALLGCGIILPKIDNDHLEILTTEQLKQVVNCLFYCINWFREIISGFAPQKGRTLRQKVVQRLNNLIDVEKLLFQYLDKLPDYKLPTSYFDQSLVKINNNIGHQQSSSNTKEKSIKQPKKKLKSVEIINDDTTILPSTSTAVPAITATKSVKILKNNKLNSDDITINFRELDTDVIRLVKYKLYTDEINCSSSSFIYNDTYLTVEQLNFILKDFVAKLTLLTTGKDLGLSHLNIVSPIDLINDCVLIFPNVNKHFIVIINRIKDLIENRPPDDPELFTEESIQLKICFGFILESILLTFTWSGFQHSKNHDLLIELFKVLLTDQNDDKNDNSTNYRSINLLSLKLVKKFTNYIEYCLTLTHAANLIKILETLNSINSHSDELRKNITNVSEKFLQKRWYNQSGPIESNKTTLINIDIIIKSYLKGINIKQLYKITKNLEEEVPKLQHKDHYIKIMQTITKSNFYILYRNICQTLYERIKIEIQNLTNQQHLDLWQITGETMQNLMQIAKILENKNLFQCFLKKSISIIKIFMSHGIPILEIMLRSKPDQVVQIFKTIQLNTRFLHHLCCSTKMHKDSTLLNYVPQFRQTLETLVYRVKAAFTGEGLIEAFWMGNLKNRNLDGESINSQISTTSTTTDHESDNEILSEIDDSDDDIFGGNIDNSNSSPKSHTESEVYE